MRMGAKAPPARPAVLAMKPCSVVRLEGAHQLLVTLFRLG